MADHTSNLTPAIGTNDWLRYVERKYGVVWTKFAQQVTITERCLDVYQRHQSGEMFADIARSRHCSVISVYKEFLRARAALVIEGVEFLTDDDVLLARFGLPGQILSILHKYHFLTVSDLTRVVTPEGDYHQHFFGLSAARREKIEAVLIAKGYQCLFDENGVPILNVAEDIPLTPERWEHCLNYWHHRCAACGSQDIPLHMDHFVPKASTVFPGTIATNIIPLCASCNTDKLNKDPYLWLIKRLGKAGADRKMREILDYFDGWREQGRE
jgi:hypothetical protein